MNKARGVKIVNESNLVNNFTFEKKKLSSLRQPLSFFPKSQEYCILVISSVFSKDCKIPPTTAPDPITKSLRRALFSESTTRCRIAREGSIFLRVVGREKERRGEERRREREEERRGVVVGSPVVSETSSLVVG